MLIIITLGRLEQWAQESSASVSYASETPPSPKTKCKEGVGVKAWLEQAKSCSSSRLSVSQKINFTERTLMSCLRQQPGTLVFVSWVMFSQGRIGAVVLAQLPSGSLESPTHIHAHKHTWIIHAHTAHTGFGNHPMHSSKSFSSMLDRCPQWQQGL